MGHHGGVLAKGALWWVFCLLVLPPCPLLRGRMSGCDRSIARAVRVVVSSGQRCCSAFWGSSAGRRRLAGREVAPRSLRGWGGDGLKALIRAIPYGRGVMHAQRRAVCFRACAWAAYVHHIMPCASIHTYTQAFLLPSFHPSSPRPSAHTDTRARFSTSFFPFCSLSTGAPVRASRVAC